MSGPQAAAPQTANSWAADEGERFMTGCLLTGLPLSLLLWWGLLRATGVL